jgi:hypothetical protein
MGLRSLTDAGEKIALDAVANGQTLYVGLLSVNGATGAAIGTELTTATATGYTRKLVTFPVATTSSGITSVKNLSKVEFDPAGNNWGNVAGIGIYTTSTPATGTALWYGNLAAAKNVTTGDIILFEPNAIELTMD